LKFSAGVIQAGFARTATSWTRPSYSCRAPARSWRAASFLDDDQVGAGYALIQTHREANLYRMKIRSQFLDVANSCPDVSPCLFLLISEPAERLSASSKLTTARRFGLARRRPRKETDDGAFQGHCHPQAAAPKGAIIRIRPRLLLLDRN
jgi:hypothetical protein